MKDKIVLRSRYNTRSNVLVKVQENRYRLETQLNYRTGTVSEGKKFVDPSGGPMIVEGHMLEEAGAVVKYIDHAMGQGYLITFE